jgi:chaperone BCS1
MELLFTLKDYIILQFQTNEFFSGGFFISAIAGIAYVLKTYGKTAFNIIFDKFTTNINVYSTDKSFPYFQRWLNDINFSKSFKRYSVVTLPESDSLILAPHDGSYFIKYKNKLIYLSYSVDKPHLSMAGNFTMFESIKLTFIGKNTAILNNLLADIENKLKSNYDNEIKINTPAWEQWREHQRLPKRNIDSVVLKENQKQFILDDVESFLNNEDWYNERDLPYRRGYLLYGSPGTGKTSLIYSIASEINKDIYFLTFNSNMNNFRFLELMNSVPEHSILVMEDIDSIFEKEDSREMTEKKELDFTTIINCIDGLCAKRGILLFMTTNHIDRLDPALIRDGRIDTRLEFTPCNSEQIEKITNRFYPEFELGKQLTEIIMEGGKDITPAELQNHLIKHKDNPKKILKGIIKND